VLRKVPKWLVDSRGPLSIRAGHAFSFLPWLVRFILASRRKNVRKTAAALASLNLHSKKLCGPLYNAAKITDLIRRSGALHLYENEREFSNSLPGWDLRAKNGIKFRHLGQAELLALESELAPVFCGATLIEDWHLVSDPGDVLHALTLLDRNIGVEFVRDSVSAICASDSGVKLEFSGSSESMSVDKAVVAAGAWSGVLAQRLGDKIPVEAERGYNTTITAPNIEINRELIFGEHGFVATRLDSGLRIGGGAEFAGLDEPPNYERATTMLRKAMNFLPGLQLDPDSRNHANRWMGCRPAMPDSCPVIGPSGNSEDILYAFGHGHVGLTQAPATGRLIAEMAMGRQPGIDAAPFSPNRFKGVSN
jgi:D-amino-acid dehydrogenase